MNIFILDESITKSVEYYMDSHVGKIMLETAQCLCTVHNVLAGHQVAPYKSTHENHPINKWLLRNKAHYYYALAYGNALAKEYTFRFEKTHATESVLDWLDWNEPDYEEIIVDQVIPVGMGVGPEYKMYQSATLESCVNSHRRYYREMKSHLAKWTKRKQPFWYPSKPIIKPSDIK